MSRPVNSPKNWRGSAPSVRKEVVRAYVASLGGSGNCLLKSPDLSFPATFFVPLDAVGDEGHTGQFSTGTRSPAHTRYQHDEMPREQTVEYSVGKLIEFYGGCKSELSIVA